MVLNFNLVKCCTRYSSFRSLSNQTKMSSDLDLNGLKILVVGMGNPDLPRTRHNVGMMLTDEIVKALRLTWQRNKNLKGHIAEKVLEVPSSEHGDDKASHPIELILLKPKVAMNINGKSVGATVSHYGVKAEHVYVLHDELDKPVGKFSIKEGGSARGHNGVRSVISSLRSDAFPRLRIGIDRPTKQSQVADYVLSDMSLEEKSVFRENVTSMISVLCHHIEKTLSLPKYSLERTIQRDISKHG